jgi:hypothetical protein
MLAGWPVISPDKTSLPLIQNQMIAHKEAIAAALKAMQRPECRRYLEETGWGDKPLLPIIASLAYKQGAVHQDNSEMLETLLNEQLMDI